MATKTLFEEVKKLSDKAEKTSLPIELKDRLFLLMKRLDRMAKFGGYTAEYERTADYVEWVVSLPWQVRTEDNLDLENTRRILDQDHHDLAEVKERILEYLAVLKLKTSQGSSKGEEGKLSRAPILSLIGLVGTGKTTLAYAIADAMGRKIGRIPFGGMESALDLRGQSRVYPDAEVGLVMKAMRRCGSKNPVILLDEIDRVAERSRADVMGVLLELLDPEQNFAFRDHFIDFPFDLSEVLFIATCNNTTNISIAVLDRLEPIQMPSYSDQDKIVIGRDYVLPRLINESGLRRENLTVDDDIWPQIVRPLGFDAGIRTLERTLAGICRKVAKMVVEGKVKSLKITRENVRQYLPSW